jgi:hypothetical protein
MVSAIRPDAAGMVRLPRFVATWSDGVERVLRAQTLADARELAARLVVPPGVKVLHVSVVR